MATNDIGARVKLDGEQQYREQLRQITQQTKLMKAENDQLQSSFGKGTTAMQKATQQSELLKSQIDRQKQSIETARANVARYSEATGENSSQTLRWKTALKEAEAELNRLEAELRQVPNSLQIMGQKMQENGQKIQSVGKAMSSVGSTLTKTVTAPIAALGVASIKTTADFDESMSKVQSLSGATGSDFDALRDKARQMGASTKYSAGESADALSYMALAGWDTNQMLDGLDGVMNLAAASGMDLAEASDIVTDYLSAFGLEAKDSAKMADEMAYAQAHSNTTTTQLGEAFGNSAAMMNTAGQSMETTTALLEAFANQGLKGSEAGTALSAMMRDITSKMKNGKIQIGDTSIAVQDQNGNFRNMVDILADVEAATEGMGSAEKSAALQTTFTARSIKGVSMALTEGTGNIRSYETALYNADGTAKDMAETMQDNLKGQLTILKSQLQELGISFGDILVPHIRKAVEWIQGMVDKFNDLDSETKEQIVKFAGLAAAIGPVLLVGGKLTTGVGKLVESGGKAVEWIGKMAGGSVGLSGALGPVAVGLAAVAGTAIAVKAGFEKIESAARDTYGELYAAVDASEAATSDMSKAGDELEGAFDDATESIDKTIASSERAQDIADELADLSKAHRLTADEQRRQKILVDELNGIYPELGLAIDETTGKLNMSTEEIQSFIDTAADMAKVKVYQEAINSVTKELSEALLAQARAQMEAERASQALSESESTLSKRAQELLDKKEDLTAMEKFELGQILAGANAYTEEGQAIHDAQGAMVKYNMENEELTEQTEKSNSLLDYLYGALEELGGGMEETAESTGEAETAVEELGDTTEETAEEIEDASQEIRGAYNQAYEAAKDSLMGQSSLWEAAEDQGETSVENMIAALQTHEDALSKWNNNSSELLNSQLYQTDETFRSMVNAVIDGGEELAPELQVIYDLWKGEDARLDELLAHYGNTDQLADEQSKNIAKAQTVTEYGLDNYATAVENSSVKIKKAFGKTFGDDSFVTRTIGKAWDKIQNEVGSQASITGATVAGEYGSGLASGTGDVDSGYQALQQASEDGNSKILQQKAQATTAGKEIGGGLASGVRAQRGDINSAFTSLRTAISTNLTSIQGLKSTARTAGRDISTSMSEGVTAGKSGVSLAMTALQLAISDGITAISNKKSTAKTAAKGIADAAKEPLQNLATSSDPSTWGRHVGDNFANGLGGANGNATTNGNKIANAARTPLANADNDDPWTWGRHMGDNFANGIGSAYGNVVYQATLLANAVTNILGHSTPKEGPLKNDDVWGLHLGQNFAQGMKQAIPMIESAALTLADAVALPTSTLLDIDAVSGRNVSETLTSADIMEAVAAGAGQIDWKVVIGNREFGRVLRDQGVFA